MPIRFGNVEVAGDLGKLFQWVVETETHSAGGRNEGGKETGSTRDAGGSG